jgi:hypothetical protein
VKAILSDFFSATPTITSGTAYASGDLIGGKLTFTNAVLSSLRHAELVGGVLYDSSKQNADIDLVIFSADPTATTFTNDSAFAVHANDLQKVVAVVKFRGTTDYIGFSANSVAIVDTTAKRFRSTGTGSPFDNLYGALVSRGTPTYTSTSALTVGITLWQDTV